MMVMPVMAMLPVVMVLPMMMMRPMVMMVMRNHLRRGLGVSEARRRGEADDQRRGGQYALDHSIPQFLFSS